MRGVLAFMAALWLAAPVQAENLALVIGNQIHDNLAEARGAEAASGAIGLLQNMGFDVLAGENLSAEEMRAQLSGLHERIDRDGADRIVVFLAGHFAQAGSGTWLMGADSTRAGLALADAEGLRLDVVLEIAALARTSAVVWLGDVGGEDAFGLGLSQGLPERLMIPQGVGVVRGRTDHLLGGLRALLRPGTSLAPLVDRNRNLTGEGTLPVTIPFLPEGHASSLRADLLAFEAAREADTEEAYLAYLDSFPNGANAQAARAALERIRNAPERVEDRLQLTRDERRAIQRDLTVLGFNTRGIDGIFGPGTRGALRLWQTQNALEETGFVTREQIFRLNMQATARAAEIEAEERERRAAQERLDREFWAATGAAGDEPGLRSYLDRYPDGIFAGLARERLADLAERARAAELARQRERDIAAWQRARTRDTLGGYQEYLVEFPQGEFAELARARIAERQPAPLPAPEPAPEPAEPLVDAQAQAAEEALGLTRPTRQLIEQRLARLGLDPGPVDGVFDDQTRVAIGQAQARFDLRQTGYVNQDLLTMLISNLFRDFFD